MNDDEYGARLLLPLATEPPAATRINVAEAMRAGRRLRRTRAWSVISGLTAVTAAAATGSALALSSPAHPKPDLPPDPTVPTACTATRLPAGGARPGAARAAVTGGDPSGTYLVGTTNPNYGDGKRTVLVWRAGKLVASASAEIGKYSVLMADINASAVAVGGTDGVPSLPYVFRHGRVSRLAGAGSAQVVNDAGTIAGTRPAGDDEIPVRWAGPDAQPEVMRLPPGFLGGRTMDMAEDGTVAVRLRSVDGPDQTYLWLPGGTARRIDPPKLPPGQGTATGFWSAYFRSGWLYGSVRTAESDVNPFASRSPDVRHPTFDDDQVFYPPVYRYHVASGTWQRLPPVETPDLTMSFGKVEAFIGRKIYAFPEPTTTNTDDRFLLSFVSDDGRTAGGRSISQRADPEHRDEAFVWRCR